MEFVFTQKGHVNYSKVVKKHHMTNRPANLNPTHVILVQTNKMLLPVTSILVIQRQEDPHVNQYLILD